MLLLIHSCFGFRRRAFAMALSFRASRCRPGNDQTARSGFFRGPSKVKPARLAWGRKARSQSPRGFTLLELLVAISIVAALSAIVLGLGRRAREASNIARAKTELAVLSAALADYQRVCGDYPRTSDGSNLLQALIGKLDPRNDVIALRSFIESARFTVTEGRDPFTDSSATLIDPWGQAYRYAYKTRSPWANASYVLYSIGGDHRDSPALLTGGFIDTTPSENFDNLYANQFR